MASFAEQFVSGAFVVLLDCVVKATVLLSMVLLITGLMRRTSAAHRHLVWSSAAFAILTLPALSLSLPSWRVFPSLALEGPAGQVRRESPAEPDLAIAKAAEATTGERSLSIKQPNSGVMTVRATKRRSKQHETASASTSMRESKVVSGSQTANGQRFQSLGIVSVRMAGSVVVLWMLGVLWTLARIGLGVAKLWQLIRKATAVNNHAVNQLVARLRKQLGIRRRIELAESVEVSMPMVCGVCRQTILLPMSATTWSIETLQYVLLHEMAHVRRFDYATQLIASVSRAVYWFHPLVWFALKRLKLEAEQASDDLVLTEGAASAPDYAECVFRVVIAMQSTAPMTSHGVGIGCKRSVEGRIRTILDCSPNRRSLRWGMIASTCLLVGLITVPLSMIPAVAQRRKAPSEPISQTPESTDATKKASRASANDVPLNAALLYWQAFAYMPDVSPEVDVATTVQGMSRPIDVKLRRVIQHSDNALRLFHSGAKLTHCDWQIDWRENGFETELPHLEKAHSFFRLSLLRARYRIEQGRCVEGIDDITAMMAFSRHISRDGTTQGFERSWILEDLAIRLVAAYLPKLPPDALHVLELRLKSLPRRTSLSESVTREQVMLEWFIDEVKRPDRGRAEELCNMVTGSVEKGASLLKDCGGRDGLLQHAIEIRPLYAELATLVRLPAFEDEVAGKRLRAKVEENPLAKWLLIPGVDAIRVDAGRIECEAALLQAAVDVAIGGKKALKNHRDPYRGGEFRYEVVDGGFQLSSRWTYPVIDEAADPDPEYSRRINEQAVNWATSRTWVPAPVRLTVGQFVDS